MCPGNDAIVLWRRPVRGSVTLPVVIVSPVAQLYNEHSASPYVYAAVPITGQKRPQQSSLNLRLNRKPLLSWAHSDTARS